MAPSKTAKKGSKSEYKDKDKPTQIRFSNITAAKGKCKLAAFFTFF